MMSVLWLWQASFSNAHLHTWGWHEWLSALQPLSSSPVFTQPPFFVQFPLTFYLSCRCLPACPPCQVLLCCEEEGYQWLQQTTCAERTHTTSTLNYPYSGGSGTEARDAVYASVLFILQFICINVFVPQPIQPTNTPT